jgi:hypothetical protein
MTVSQSPEVLSRRLSSLEYGTCIGSFRLFKFQVPLTENESELGRIGDEMIILSRH